MVSTWRLAAAAVLTVLAYILCNPLLAAVLGFVRHRAGKRFRWIADIQTFVLAYLSWVCFLLLLLVIATHILQLDSDGIVVNGLTLIIVVPLVFMTFALRRVLTNIIVRHFKWDKQAEGYSTRIFIVTQTVKFICFIAIIAEIFYFFFSSNEVAGVLILVLFGSMELTVILSTFTVLKNIAMGLFLIFAEPFRTGSFCRIAELVGYIERVSLARIIMRRRDGALVYIPTGLFANFSQSNDYDGVQRRMSIVLQLDRSTELDRVHHLLQMIKLNLEQYATPPQHDSASTVRDSFHSSVSIGTGRGSSEITSGVDARLLGMHLIKVDVTVDEEMFKTTEAARTQVNLAIAEALQKTGISARQVVR